MKKLCKTNDPGRGFDIVVDGQTDGGTDKTSSTVTLIDVWIVAFYVDKNKIMIIIKSATKKLIIKLSV